jgi:hypothetical protein
MGKCAEQSGVPADPAHLAPPLLVLGGSDPVGRRMDEKALAELSEAVADMLIAGLCLMLALETARATAALLLQPKP